LMVETMCLPNIGADVVGHAKIADLKSKSKTS
jgi:hypothetical protein